MFKIFKLFHYSAILLLCYSFFLVFIRLYSFSFELSRAITSTSFYIFCSYSKSFSCNFFSFITSSIITSSCSLFLFNLLLSTIFSQVHPFFTSLYKRSLSLLVHLFLYLHSSYPFCRKLQTLSPLDHIPVLVQ